MAVFTSYLQLGDRLSQVWLNKYTLALFLAMIKLLFFSKSIENSITSSEQYILAHCSTIDSLYSETMGSTPHYMAIMGNFLIRETMIQSVKATLGTLSMLVYASEEMLNFVIDLYLGTYVCLIVSAIDGSVDVATNATEKIIGAVNHTVSALASDLDNGLEDISQVVNKVLSAANKIEDFFNGDSDDNVSSHLQKVNLTVSSLRNLYIPSSINEKLEELSAKTPDFAQAKNISKHILGLPFEKVRKEIQNINATNIVGNSSMLYVPPKSINSSTEGICTAGESDIRKFYDSISHVLTIATVVCTVLLVVGALCVTIPVANEEIRLWRRLCDMRTQYMETHGPQIISKEETLYLPFKTSQEETHFDVIANYQQCFHRWNYRISNFLVALVEKFNPQKGNNENAQRAKIRWVIAYITSERALCILGIGLLGIAVTILQLILVAVLQRALRDISSSSTNNFNGTQVAKMLNHDLDQWAQGANLYINSTQNNVNKQVFGWVDTTTVAVNKTVNKVIDEIDDTLARAFNGTLLYKPMKTVVGCVIENKLYSVEKAMTWIHDKARIDMPDIKISEIEQALKKSSSSSASSLLPKIGHDIHSAIKLALDTFHHTAMYELVVALSLLGIWLLQIPIALVIASYRSTRISKY
ncbi:ZYBA0S14-01354g1_1 [Zygosaccharomyces bailii CLIB 213]|uniref:Plasma membrane fusion protein PRM1 n=1 Tax=Zygosaccharomyces bailii (strain CLIB 213 / ATCC 58445 / CBS 680 / BCRC 21525 / NBRC 1098 / NCYC 1416 / NRRL Y-2227) TaxID=1333698 RepID=A0A8J2TBG5_ZYGB2|nr:ZYBA0S14-01354g1_1 [Zygosaccharomyces bailii CLIB 213]